MGLYSRTGANYRMADRRLAGAARLTASCDSHPAPAARLRFFSKSCRCLA